MKTFDYVPTVCKGEVPKYVGTVTMRRPTFDEKFDILEQIGDPTGQDNMSKFKAVRKLVSLSKDFYVKIQLKNVESGEDFTSVQALEEENDLHSVLIEVANLLPEGFSSGNA